MVHDLYCTQALVDRAEPVHFGAQRHSNASGACDLALGHLAWSHGTLTLARAAGAVLRRPLIQFTDGDARFALDRAGYD
jgi:hypothetical protein